MIAAIPVETGHRDARLYPRFARSPFFAIADTAAGSVRIVANPHAEDAQGLGISAVSFLADECKADTLVAYELGLKVQKAAHSLGLGQIILHTDQHSLAGLLEMMNIKQ